MEPEVSSLFQNHFKTTHKKGTTALLTLRIAPDCAFCLQALVLFGKSDQHKLLRLHQLYIGR